MNFFDFIIKGPSTAHGMFDIKSNANATGKESHTLQKIVHLWQKISKKCAVLLASSSTLGLLGLGALGFAVISNPFSAPLVIAATIAATAYVAWTFFLTLRTTQAVGQTSSWKNTSPKEFVTSRADFFMATKKDSAAGAKIEDSTPTPPHTSSNSLSTTPLDTLESKKTSPMDSDLSNSNLAPIDLKSSAAPTQTPSFPTDFTTTENPSVNSLSSIYIYEQKINKSKIAKKKSTLNEFTVSSIQLRNYFRTELLKLSDRLNQNQLHLVMNLFDKSMRNQYPRHRFEVLVNANVSSSDGWDLNTAHIIKSRLSRYVPKDK